jgi:hypothetical protein
LLPAYAGKERQKDLEALMKERQKNPKIILFEVKKHCMFKDNFLSQQTSTLLFNFASSCSFSFVNCFEYLLNEAKSKSRMYMVKCFAIQKVEALSFYLNLLIGIM